MHECQALMSPRFEKAPAPGLSKRRLNTIRRTFLFLFSIVVVVAGSKARRSQYTNVDQNGDLYTCCIYT